MKNKIITHYLCLTLILFSSLFANSLYGQDKEGTHVRKGVDSGDGWIEEYVFNNTEINAAFLPNFPLNKMEQEISESILKDWTVEYYVYTSVEDAELAMVERLEMSNIGMYNMIDSILPNGSIGDNCWHQLNVGAIRFLRNNVFVSIGPKYPLPHEEYAKADWMARTIETLLIESDKVADAKLIPAPEIQSVEITSDLPKNWDESVKIKVNATDPNSLQLYYRRYRNGIEVVSKTGDLAISLHKNVNAIEDSTKAKVKIWVWNEDNIVASVDYEIPF